MICGEIAIRVYHWFKYDTNQPRKSIVLDDKLGWLPTSRYLFHGDKLDATGEIYSVKIQTNHDGFRIFGNLREEDKKKVLFLGDSFTHALEVSDDKTYYAILKKNLPIEVFAFGGLGYGTLQEYMILEKYADEIRPDIVVIQFSSNDFINNSYELESRSCRNNNGMRRPYLMENGVIYKIPKSAPLFRNIANGYSRFLYFILNRIDRLNAVHADSVEDIIQKRGMSYPLFRESVEITEQLINKMKLRIPSKTLLYAFCVDDTDPYYEEFKRLSKKNGIYFIDGIPQAIRSAEQRGITTRAKDKAHWNETGHRIAADVLKRYYEANW